MIDNAYAARDSTEHDLVARVHHCCNVRQPVGGRGQELIGQWVYFETPEALAFVFTNNG